jgi:hypothetical protein
MSFGWMTRKRIVWNVWWSSRGQVVVELRPLGLDNPDAVRIMLSPEAVW